jgi:hypothetical protein
MSKTCNLQSDQFYGAINYNHCSLGHIIYWAGSSNYEIPEGTLCACGQTRVKYITCQLCGHRKMQMIPTGE